MVMFWKTTKLHPNINVQTITPSLKLSTLLQAKIETIWHNKKKQFPNLFNGRVFNVHSLTPNLIQGYWTEYKFVMAQTENPSLYEDLRIRSLAVIGLIQCPNGFIFGKRSKNAVYLPNYWQSAPAGTVESRNHENEVNLFEQLYAETKEELGLNKEDFIKPRVISATEHEHTHIIDIGIYLKTFLPFQTIYEKWQDNANPEYMALSCIPNNQMLPDQTLPTTRYLINNY